MVKTINLYNSFDIKSNHKGARILIGNFDGLHLGHQKLFSSAKDYKKKHSLKIGVLTFEPMPKMYFNKSIKNFRISNQEQKFNLLNKLNVDFVITKKFNKRLFQNINLTNEGIILCEFSSNSSNQVAFSFLIEKLKKLHKSKCLAYQDIIKFNFFERFKINFQKLLNYGNFSRNKLNKWQIFAS